MLQSEIKPVELYGRMGTANPLKVAIILDALNIPFKMNYIEFADSKDASYLRVNPNGRCPSLVDPNTGITIWESGAIIEYIIDEYDKDHVISIDSFPEKYHLKQWLHFQMSGQGPYFGQLAWFSWYHKERLDSAIDRYSNEVRRVMGVLDAALKESDWLVGDHVTFADLALVPWFFWIPKLLGKDVWENDLSELPNFKRWWANISEVPAVMKNWEGEVSVNYKVARKDVQEAAAGIEGISI